MNHTLSLEVPETLNLCQLRIQDSSVYSSLIPITCPELYVTLPGFTRPVCFVNPTITPGFILNLTACDLDIQTLGCGTTFADLPDGIYIIKYSVSPNDIVYVEYNHLRISKALTRIQGILCDLELSTCTPPEITQQKAKKLAEVRLYLDAAKAKVEYCHNPIEGMQLFNYSLKLLDKIQCKTCR